MPTVLRAVSVAVRWRLHKCARRIALSDVGTSHMDIQTTVGLLNTLFPIKSDKIFNI